MGEQSHGDPPGRPPGPPGRPPGPPGRPPGRREKTPDGKAIRRQENRSRDADDREVLDIVVGAEGIPGVLRKTVRHPERLTPQSLDWIHADLERMLELAEYHARIGTLNPLLESEETDAEAQGSEPEPGPEPG